MNVAVILAGGKGLRLGNHIPKQMLLLGNKPVISWSVDTFSKVELIDKIILVSEKSIINDMMKLFPITSSWGWISKIRTQKISKNFT